MYYITKLGLNIKLPQAVVLKNTIFASSVKEEGTFSLVGCMVSPGFNFEDFELFTQEQLLKRYPHHESIIRKLAYQTLP